MTQGAATVWRPRTVPAIGSHCILELYGCPASTLGDKERIVEAIRRAAKRAGSTLVGEVAHRFEPQGVTALALLAESHISVHTWPELGYAACDVFTCGSEARPEQACEVLVEALEAERYELRRTPRGDPALATPERSPRTDDTSEVA